MKEKQQPDSSGEEKIRQAEPDFLKQYRSCYPNVKKFHVTGDCLVFFDRDYEQAIAHQRTIGKGELKTY